MAQAVKLNLEIDELRQALDGEIDEAMFAGGQIILDAAQDGAPVDDGILRDSGYVATPSRSSYRQRKEHRQQAKVGHGEAVIGFAAYWAGFVETGTPPHTIGEPGQILRMPDGSFVRGPIHHPGAAAQPYLRPALDSKQRAAVQAIVERLRKGIGA